MRPVPDTQDPAGLDTLLLAAGGTLRTAGPGGAVLASPADPPVFLYLLSGQVSVRFRAERACNRAPWIECRVSAGQDCMPVTAAILSGAAISFHAISTGRAAWIELPPEGLRQLVHSDARFRHDLFAGHARRLPFALERAARATARSLDRRLAGWLIDNAGTGRIVATHACIAADLLTAREVVSRRLRDFAARGWIEQSRGAIRVVAPAALSRCARDAASWPCAASTGDREAAGLRATP
ncbi:helix-turn-helix domain-containing protein [Rhodobacterales bacterium HKCCE2091]|nr:helix-turn-helix domain-containing protein [Rhodobacterales bacterium HKCCE2091]